MAVVILLCLCEIAPVCSDTNKYFRIAFSHPGNLLMQFTLVCGVHTKQQHETETLYMYQITKDVKKVPTASM